MKQQVYTFDVNVVREPVEEIAVTLEALLEQYVPLGSLFLVLTFLLYEDIFPKQLTGPGPDGERITLPVCLQTGRNPVIFPTDPTSTAEISPDLDKCINFLSARSWDRAVDLYAQTIGTLPLQEQRAKRRDKEFCGHIGSIQYCFPPCEQGFGGIIKRPLGQISCFVYNHGLPSAPEQTFNEMLTFFVPYLLVEGTIIDPDIHQICSRLLNIKVAPRPLYCLPLCENFPFNPTTSVRKRFL